MHAHFNTFLFYKMASGLDCSDSQSDVSSIRKISDVWKYFTKTPDKKKAICSICHRELAYSGGTTNLRNRTYATTYPQNTRFSIFLLARHLLGVKQQLQMDL